MPGDSKTAFDIGEMFQVLCQHYLLINCVWYGAGSLQHDSNLLCSVCLLTRHVCYGAGSLQYNSNLLLSVCLLMRYVCYGAGSLQHNSNLLRGASGRPGVRLWQVEVFRGGTSATWLLGPPTMLLLLTNPPSHGTLSCAGLFVCAV